MIKKVQIPLWTNPYINISNFDFSNNISHNEIEIYLKNKFNTHREPVLLSSARIGILIALLISKIQKDELIDVFPYSSFCVNRAISKVASPKCSITQDDISKKIHYHFWGNVFDTKENNIFLEDAVDTFCAPGVTISEFGGQFEIWSLSKIIGTIGGGILWCANNEIATQAKKIRDIRIKGTNRRWFFRFLSSRYSYFARYWFYQELIGGPLPNWGLNQINKALGYWDQILEERKQRIYLIENFDKNLSPNHKFRFPSAIPIKLSEPQVKDLTRCGYIFNLLHFPLNNKLQKVLPLSMHQQFPLEELGKVLKIIS